MKTNRFLLLILIATSTTIEAQTLESPWPIEAKDYKKIVLESIESEVIKVDKDEKDEDPQLQAASPKVKQPLSPLSKGERRVQEILKKKRQALQLKQNQASPTWLQEKSSKQNSWIKENKESKAQWIKRKREILNKWKRSKDTFRKDIPQIKRHLIPTKQLKQSLDKDSEIDPVFGASSKLNRINRNSIAIVNETFEIPVKHQGHRATCAAFSAIRSLEIDILKKEKKLVNLSEEYFFYLSRPDCHSKRCSIDGSWPRLAFKELVKERERLRIPLESQCPYNYTSASDNIFHLPLKKDCSKGERKVSFFNQLHKDKEAGFLSKKKNSLVMGFYIEDHFIDNNGLVYSNQGSKGNNKSFAHTVLIVGVIPLPKVSHQSIGSYCLLSVNSWGTGWGIGGYACLGEKWVKEHRVPNKSLYAAIQPFAS